MSWTWAALYLTFMHVRLEGESCFASQKLRDRWTHFLNHFNFYSTRTQKLVAAAAWLLLLALLLAKTGSIKNKVDR